MKTGKWKKTAAKAAGFSVLCIGVLGSIDANAVQSGPFGIIGSEVDDTQLASMRGRFVDGRNVTFFGIRMQTQWQRQGASALEMEMHVNFDFSGDRYRPEMKMYRSRNIGAQVSNANKESRALTQVSDNSVLENVSGVVQNIQVAGDGNTVRNGVEWLVTDQHSRPEPGDDLVELNQGGIQAHQTEDGVQTRVAVDDEAIGYQVDVPDIGTVAQQISRTQFSGGNILQSTQLNANLNQVLNRIGLTVELSPSLGGSRIERFHHSLAQLRGL